MRSCGSSSAMRSCASGVLKGPGRPWSISLGSRHRAPHRGERLAHRLQPARLAAPVSSAREVQVLLDRSPPRAGWRRARRRGIELGGGAAQARASALASSAASSRRTICRSPSPVASHSEGDSSFARAWNPRGARSSRPAPAASCRQRARVETAQQQAGHRPVVEGVDVVAALRSRLRGSTAPC